MVEWLLVGFGRLNSLDSSSWSSCFVMQNRKLQLPI